MNSGVFFEAGIDQLAAQQEQGRLVVEPEIAERVGQNLRHPDQAGLHVADKEKLDRPEQEAADPDRKPDLGNPGG